MQAVEEEKREEATPAQKIDNSVILCVLLILGGGWYLYDFFANNATFNLSMNIVIIRPLPAQQEAFCCSSPSMPASWA